ncbi:MAG: BACON domain-containing protein [Candidatus Latescibacterota bacterium]|nr:MAG: BACON domain-containing protein [Candidatus Latescibacterota bacterium]
MKRILIAACLVLLSVNLAIAQTGTICLFADPSGLDCTINDLGPGLITVYVVHMDAVDVRAVRFSAPVPACMNAVYLGDMFPWPIAIGNSQTGVEVGFPECLSSPIHILTINIFGQGLSIPDCPYEVLPDPEIGYIQVTDCNEIPLAGQGGTTFVNSSLPCVCTSSTDPTLYVNPLTLDFGTTDVTESFVIGNTAGGSLVWDVTETIPWLDATPTSGAGGATITVTVDRTGLAPGNYNGLIQVTSNGGNETVTAFMSVALPEPVLGVTPASLNFPAHVTAKLLTIANLGTGYLYWNITSDQPWLSVSPAIGTNDTQVAVSVDRTGLPDGTYNGTLSITSNGGDGTVPVEMIVDTQPQLSVTPASLTFTPSVLTGTFTISNAGFGTLEWSLSADETWIIIDPPLSGTGTATVTVHIDSTTVPSGGTHTGNVLVTSNGGNQPVVIRYIDSPPTFGGTIGVYTDAAGSECGIQDVPGLLPLYVVHVNTLGATASQFAAPMPSCMTGVSWLSDSPEFSVTLGNSQIGVAVGYGSCLVSPIHVLTINYFASGTSETCCMYPVIADPNVPSGMIEVVDCASNLLYAMGATCIVNPTNECRCDVSVEESTWGRVKALYAPESVKATRQ